MAKWRWEEIDPSRSSTSGDVSKLFKNEQPKAPGILALGDPPAEATLLARETIQNAWDAARELREELAGSASPPQFEITFDYRSVDGAAKQEMIGHLGLGELADRHARVSDQPAIRDALDSPDGFRSLRGGGRRCNAWSSANGPPAACTARGEGRSPSSTGRC